MIFKKYIILDCFLMKSIVCYLKIQIDFQTRVNVYCSHTMYVKGVEKGGQGFGG